MIIVEGKETSNPKTTPLEVIDPTQRVVQQAKSEMMHNIKVQKKAQPQSKRKPQKRKTVKKEVNTKVRRIKDILS